MGSICDSDINECNGTNGTTPCHLGACTNTPGSYYCTCHNGIIGKHCDEDHDECDSSPCKYGGTCKNLINRYSCSCLPEFTGKNCETPLNFCSLQLCQNGATCDGNSTDFTCKCRSGFTGSRCEVNIDNCAEWKQPCLNGATCVDGVNTFTCQCVSGFHGRQCEMLGVVSFKQNSFLPVSPPRYWDNVLISFQFRTTVPNGRLLYQGAVSTIT